MSQYSGLENKKILVVEDVELNQYLARHIMESWGCVVEIAENGREAVDRITQCDYDLVLMDIQMPVMDGIEATKQIRKMEDDSKSTIPIVALTANALRSECDTYIKIGMNDWLGKPFQEPALFKTVSRNIRKISVMNTKVIEAKVEETVAAPARLYDLSMVEAISGGDRSFINKMLLLFLETVPVTLDEFKRSAADGQWLMLSKHAHKLKSTIDSMGIASLKQVIREIESGGKHGEDPEGLRSRVNEVMKVMKEVIDEVRRETSDVRRQT